MHCKALKLLMALAAALALALALPALAKPPGGVPPGQAKKQGVSSAKGGPPPWAPAHGYRAKHKYRYYPAQRVYYAPDRGVYFWLDGGSWQVGARLPGSIHISGDGITLGMDTDRPYTWHEDVVRYYPPR